MEKITDLLNKIDFTKLVPDLQTLLDGMVKAATVAIMAGPLILLFLGLIYLLIPPREANHFTGFRTYFGMGSVDAWLFTQKLAGIVLGTLGLVLSIVMYCLRKELVSTDVMQIIQQTGRYLVWQIMAVVIAYVGISMTVTVIFDRKGRRRFGRKKEAAQEAKPE